MDPVFIILKGDDYIESDPYCQQLQESGYLSFQVPPLSFEFVNIEQLTARLSQTDSYCGLVLTSTRAVEACQRACASDSKLFNVVAAKLLFPVGPKTFEALNAAFNSSTIDEQIVNSLGSAESLASAIVKNFSDPIKSSGKPLLMPSSSIAKETIPSILSEKGIQVDCFACYHTWPNPNLSQKLAQLLIENKGKNIFMVLFSPSGVDSLRIALDNLSTGVDRNRFKFIAIGKTTSKALSDLNWPIFCVSEKPNPISLYQSIAAAMDKE
ncbi:uroporphyrinogen-III synthase-like [Tetranychus urticae]|uniref:Tetrapyrrole biosynthesis uroporphyrinogen III synthase domain-containing protein n=1 Tax=Tetranychus urticae TaxID=32264 RepID=T1K1X9_TETUR|nr:uroporphyrinogen-III synthase-like [Tetranychus urticae]